MLNNPVFNHIFKKTHGIHKNDEICGTAKNINLF